MSEGIRYQDKPWLNHYEAGVPEKIEYETICLPDILRRSAEQFPDRMALLFQGYQVTFRQLDEMVDRFANCLHDLGIRKGDSVAILLPNLIPCVAAYYAILRIGAITVMNNPLYSDRELAHQFNDSGAKLLITLDLLANRMIDLRPQTSIGQIVYTRAHHCPGHMHAERFRRGRRSQFYALSLRCTGGQPNPARQQQAQ